MKPTKTGSGTYLELTFQVIEGQYKNRLLWSRLNLSNPTIRRYRSRRGSSPLSAGRLV